MAAALQAGWMPFQAGSVFLVFALGLCLGSFLNVAIHRMPRGLSLLRPASRCPLCGHSIRPWHNVPLLGWMALRGRCADCGAPIPVRYPLVELAGGLLALPAAFAFPAPAHSVAALWLFLALLAVFFIDLEHRIIPDEISLGGTILGLSLSPLTIGLAPAALGAACGAGALLLIRWGYRITRGRDGMGLGDVKLAAMLGAFLGVPGLGLTVLFASILGSAWGGTLVLLRRGSGGTALPFGSFLAPAGAVVLIWGPRIWQWYMGLFPSR